MNGNHEPITHWKHLIGKKVRILLNENNEHEKEEIKGTILKVTAEITFLILTPEKEIIYAVVDPSYSRIFLEE